MNRRRKLSIGLLLALWGALSAAISVLASLEQAVWATDDGGPLFHKHFKHKKHRRHRASDERFSSFGFVTEPSDLIVAKDSSARFDCVTTGVSKFKLEWRKDGTTLVLDTTGRRSVLTNGSLVINKVYDSRAFSGGSIANLENIQAEPNQLTDEGVYQCAVVVENVGTFVSRRASLTVAVLSRFEDQPKDRTVELGSVVVIPCRIDGTPKPAITWFRDGSPMQLLNSSNSVLSAHSITQLPLTGSLEIRNFSANDQGAYHCKAENMDKHRLSEEGKLRLSRGAATIDLKQPEFESTPEGMVLRRGESVLLECAVNGQPLPKIQWLKDQELLDTLPHNLPNADQSHYTIIGQGSLFIRSVELSDAGQYTCRAINAVDSVDSSTTVAVHAPPAFTTTPQSAEAKETEDVVFECQAEGQPGPAIAWYRNGEALTPSDYFRIEGKKLKILGLVVADSGVLQCFADNTAGSVQASAQLIVKQSELINEFYQMFTGKNRSVLLVAHASSAFNFTLDVTSTATSLPVVSTPPAPVAKNTPLEQEQPGALALPSEPQRLRATFAGARYATLRWDPPLMPNGDIVAYSVYYKQDTSERERVLNTTAGANLEQVTVNMLQPATVYNVRVLAYNKNGAGASTVPIKVRTVAEKAVPGKVRNLRVETLSPTSTMLRWDPPLEEAASVSSYKLFYANADDEPLMEETEDGSFQSSLDETEIQISETKTNYEFHDLDAFTLYSFRVEAHNRNGAVQSSDSVQTRTYSDVPSGPPQNITAEASSSTALLLSWLPPLKQECNGIITGYKIRYKAKSRNNQAHAFTTDGNARSHVINALHPGSSYSIRIAAVTVNGTGPPSNWITANTLPKDVDETKVPDAPAQLQVQPRSTSIVVAWSPPANEDSVMIRGYIIGWGVTLPDVQLHRLDGQHRSFTIENLRPGKEYIVSVKAFNRVGNGFPMYETTRTLESAVLTNSELASENKATPTDALAGQLDPPMGLRALALSSSSIQLSWSDGATDEKPNTDNRYYTVRYNAPYGSSGKHKFVNVSETSYTADGLRPDTQYEFSVKTVRGKAESGWSMAVVNTTLTAAPASAPWDLSVVAVNSNPTTVVLSWQPPKSSNGPITGYIILWTTDISKPDRAWSVQTIEGDRLSATVTNLKANTDYFFKIQARNDKGYGPQSSPVELVRSPGGDLEFHGRRKSVMENSILADGSKRNDLPMAENGSGGEAAPAAGASSSPNMAVTIGIIIGAFCVLAAAGIGLGFYFCRSKDSNKRPAYQPGVKKTLPSSSANGANGHKRSKPDLWINHDSSKRCSDKPMPESNLGSLQDLCIAPLPAPDIALRGLANGMELIPTGNSVFLTNNHTSTMERPIGKAKAVIVPSGNSTTSNRSSFNLDDQYSMVKGSNGTLSRRSNGGARGGGSQDLPDQRQPLLKAVAGPAVGNDSKFFQYGFEQPNQTSPANRSPFGSAGLVGCAPQGMHTPTPPLLNYGPSGHCTPPSSSCAVSIAQAPNYANGTVGVIHPCVVNGSSQLDANSSYYGHNASDGNGGGRVVQGGGNSLQRPLSNTEAGLGLNPRESSYLSSFAPSPNYSSSSPLNGGPCTSSPLTATISPVTPGRQSNYSSQLIRAPPGSRSSTTGYATLPSASPVIVYATGKTTTTATAAVTPNVNTHRISTLLTPLKNGYGGIGSPPPPPRDMSTSLGSAAAVLNGQHNPLSNSTEELHAQMQSLDSLMHDLSEISRTEFDAV